MATYHVRNAAGEDFQTIAQVNAAMGSFAAGDSILFNRGDTWNLNVGGEADRLLIQCSGNADTDAGRITFGAYGTGNLPLFDATSATDWAASVVVDSRSYVVIEYLDIYNSLNNAIRLSRSPFEGHTDNSSYIRIRYNTLRTNRTTGQYIIDGYNYGSAGGLNHIWIHNNTVSGSLHNGIKVYNGAQYIYIYNNTVSDCFHHGIDGLNTSGSPGPYNSYFYVYGNNIYNCPGAIYLPGHMDSEIYENDIHDNSGEQTYGYTGIKTQGYNSGQPEAPLPVRVTIRNNRIWDIPSNTGGGAAIVVNDGTDCNVWNNTIYNSVGTFQQERNTGLSVKNNLTYDNIADDHSAYDGVYDMMDSHWTGGADPLFVDAVNNNFHLEATSPCIDKGINVGLPYNGTAPDLGAYEYGGTSPQRTLFRP